MRRIFPVIFILGLCSLLCQSRVSNAQQRQRTGTSSAFSQKQEEGESAKSGGQNAEVSKCFFEIANELAKQRIGTADSVLVSAKAEAVAGQKNLNAESAKSGGLNADIEQAIAFLTAARKLSAEDKATQALLLELYCEIFRQDYTSEVFDLLMEYADKDADLELSSKALNYIIEKQDTPQKRQQMLEKLLMPIGGKNTYLGSHIAMMLGMIEEQKHNLETARQYYLQAYTNNRYNKQAFEKLQKLSPERVGSVVLLQRERLNLRVNPLDIEAVISFAGCAEKLQMFDTAAAAYEYGAQLFGYLYPSRPLDARIYIPWAINCYNTDNQAKCLEIAERIRAEGRFDLTVESIAGRAALKIGEKNLGQKILIDAAIKAESLIRTTPDSNSRSGVTSGAGQVSVSGLAWFYCFVLQDPNKGLIWANKALSAEPASSTAASYVAYALMMNNVKEQAEAFLSKSQGTQIADLVRAQIQLKDAQKTEAIQTLKTAIEKDPSSFAAERAKEIMAQQGQEYNPPLISEAVVAAMPGDYGKNLVPVFTRPEKFLTAELETEVNELVYGEKLNASVVIKNNSQEAMIINDDALFKGNIRIDAIVSGDLSKNIPMLASQKIQPSGLIEPGRSLRIPVVLMTGQLKRMLQTYPQASLKVEFSLYIDPVEDKQGRVTNRLTYIQPTKTVIHRPAVKLTGQYLQERYLATTRNQTNEKIQTAGLFVGLLKELDAMSGRTPSYKPFMYADWEPDFLKGTLTSPSGLLRNTSESDWSVKVYTMAQMLDLQLNYELIEAVSANLSSEKWPVRMMAVYLLAKTQKNKFQNVLDWMADKKNESNESVRNLAIALRKTSAK